MDRLTRALCTAGGFIVGALGLALAHGDAVNPDPSVVTLVSARDSMLFGPGTGLENINYGAHRALRLSGHPGGGTVLGFDLPAINLEQLESAQLILTLYYRFPTRGWGQSGALVAAYALDEDWSEGNGGGVEPGAGSGVTWNCASDSDISNTSADCDTLWQRGGGEEATDFALHTNGMQGQVSWDVTADLVAGKSAWLLRSPTLAAEIENGGQTDSSVEEFLGSAVYYSREGAIASGNSDGQPKLLLQFSQPQDRDGDGVPNESDAFPDDPTETSDQDFDGIGDNSDPDRDGDGVENSSDAFPDNSTETSDQDGDGVGDTGDTDVDGDGVPNDADAFPFDPSRSALPLLSIDSPGSLITVGGSPLEITGQVDPEAVSLTVNGEPVAIAGNSYTALVALQEGHNIISARMVTADGGTSTASISVSLDLTPPYITVESHRAGDTVYTDSVAVTGLVNDIVRGTIENTQALVTVNGVVAEISNRSYAARGVVLSEGSNTLVVTARDQVGNVASNSLLLTYQAPPLRRLRAHSGDAQSGTINTTLAEPLTILVTDSYGAPRPNAEVLFRVTQGAGRVAANTPEQGRAVRVLSNNQGLAATEFALGSRVGTGNHKVRAQVVGYDTQVIFTHSASARLGNKVSVNSGNNQRGGVYQTLPAPLTVAVTDVGSNVVSGAQVQFSVSAGGGYFPQADGSKPQTVVLPCDSDGRASALWVLGGVTGMDRQRVDVRLLNTDAEYTSSVPRAGFTASAFVPGDAGNTAISGLVQDNQGRALPGTIITVDGTARTAVADAQGQFTVTQAPVGALRLLVDGSATSVEGNYPTLSYDMVTIAGVDNPLFSPVYLVKLDTDNAVSAGAQDVELTLSQVPGFKLEVAAGSVTFPDGSHEGLLSVTPVNSNRVPMPPPNGMQPKFIATIQPAGARFDPPAPLSLPNVDGHPPGAQVEMYSFDHDLEEFVAIGLGTISEDGTVLRSNPGVGVIKAGWHCGSQPADDGICSGASDFEPEKKDCWNTDCNNPTANERALGNPIETSTGNKFVREGDYQGSGAFPLLLSRYYNSKTSLIAPGWSAGFHSSYSANLSHYVHDVGFKAYEYCVNFDSGNSCVEFARDFIYEREYYLAVRQDNGDVLTYPVAKISRTGRSLMETPFPNWEQLVIPNRVYPNSHGDFSAAERVADGETLWIVRDKNGRVQEFDRLGRLSKLSKVSGEHHTISHQGNQRTVADTSGNTMVQTLNELGSLSRAVIGELVYEYDYDSSGRLSRATYPGGTYKTYHYEDPRFPSALTGITDEAGLRYVTWGYDSRGRAVSSEHPGDTGRHTLSFISDAEVLATNPLGKQTTYRFEKINGVKKLVEVEGHPANGVMARFKSYGYYDNGLMKSRTDWEGVVTRFDYDNRGLEIRRTEAFGTPLQRVINTNWHPLLPQRMSVSEPGRLTRYQYNPQRRLQGVVVAERGTHFSYDSVGRLLSIDGPRDDVSDITTFTYSGNHLSGTTNALHQHSQLLDYNGYGQPRKLVDPNGVVTLLVYNPRGWLSESTIKSRDGDATTSIVYSDSGLVERITQANGSYMAFAYDSARRLTSMSNKLGERISYTLDAMGNRVEEVVVDGSGVIIAQRSRVFDDLGRLLEDIGAASQNTAFEYDPNGNITLAQDPKGQVTQRAYDALQRLQQIVDPINGITQLDYDARDNLAAVSDPRLLTTSYSYNAHDQLVSQSSPDTGITTFQYDAAGNVISRTDARGIVTQYSYDALNRLVTQHYPSDSSLQVSYSYDANTLAPQADESYNAGIGKLTGITDASGGLSFSYDDRGNLTAQVQQFSIGAIQNHRSTHYAYDLSNRLTFVRYPSGLEVNYSRDALGRIAGVSASYTTESGENTKVPILSAIAHQAFGAISGAVYGNGLSLSRTFDNDSRLIMHRVGDVMDYNFNYDNNGNIVQIQDGVTPILTGHYKYDALDRLSEERRNSVQQAFNYDAVGNRLAITQPLSGSAMQTNTYSETSNRLIGQDGVAVASDPAGNIIAWDEKGWTYDASSRMSAYTESGNTKATYAYNGLGQRVIKTRPDQQRERHTILHFNAAGQIIQETIFDSVNMPVEHRSYIWVDSMPVAYLKQVLVNGDQVDKHKLVYLHTDQLNTPRIGTNQDGDTVWRWDSDAFGVGDVREIDDGSGVAAVINLRMPGQYFDGEGGSFYNYFRDYEPGVGRYLQSDPIGLAGGLNSYSYSLQNPTRYVDSTGTGPVGVALAVACEVVNGVNTALGFKESGEAIERVNLLRENIRKLNEADASCPADRFGSDAHQYLLQYRDKLRLEQLAIAIQYPSIGQTAAVGGFGALVCSALLGLPF